MTTASQREWLTVRDVAIHMAWSEETVRRRIRAGRLRAVVDGGRLRVRRAWVEEYEATLVEATVPPAPTRVRELERRPRRSVFDPSRPLIDLRAS